MKVNHARLERMKRQVEQQVKRLAYLQMKRTIEAMTREELIAEHNRLIGDYPELAERGRR